jgi:hypothetical protein
MRWADHVAHIGDRRDAYRVLAQKLERRKPLGRPRRRWEDNIKMDFQKWNGGMKFLIWLRTGTGGGIV